MSGSVLSARSGKTAAQRALLLVGLGLTALMAWSPAVGGARIAARLTYIAPTKLDPDAALIAIYKDLAANDLRGAQRKADALVLAFPNFSLGQLIRGDLLLMHAHPITALGSGSNGPADKIQLITNHIKNAQ